MMLDRSRRADDLLVWKVRVFSVAAVFGVAGIYFGERWMTVTAIVVLTAGLALRFLPGRRSAERGESESDDGPGEDEPRE